MAFSRLSNAFAMNAVVVLGSFFTMVLTTLMILLVFEFTTIFGSDPRLMLVNIVFRHGDRTPTLAETFPKDPYANYTFFPTGRGGLTMEGKRREFHLGEVLRSRYDEFLGEFYYPEIISALSSDTRITKMSLELVLAGLFPPSESQRWSDNLAWQPVPFEYENDGHSFWAKECSAYRAELARVGSTTEVKERLAEFDGMMRSLSGNTGAEITTTLDLWLLYRTLAGQEAAGLPLPDWASEFYPDGGLSEGVDLYYQIMAYNNKLKRLSGGVMLGRIFRDALSLMEGTLEGGRRLFLYSGYGENIAGLQLALGVYEPHVPAYSSAVIIELWEKNKKFYFKVLYHTGVPSKIVAQRIPGCSELCPTERFLKILKPVMETESDFKCEKNWE